MIVLVGFTSSGKDSIQDELQKKGFEKVVSYSSRPMRQGETNGIEYNFISKDDFQKLFDSGKLLEFREYNTLLNGIPDSWCYGTPRDIRVHSVCTVDLLGSRSIKEKYPGACTIFLNTPEELRRKRCIGRKDFDITEWNRRYEDDMKKLEEFRDILEPEKINTIDYIIDVKEEDSIEYLTKKIKEIYIEHNNKA